MYKYFLFLFFSFNFTIKFLSANLCKSNPTEEGCFIEKGTLHRYLLYDINPYEGFNLRRDVYMRLAIFIKNLNEVDDISWHLVLPPWNNLIHWKSVDIGRQTHISWSLFFDVGSLQNFSPVIEMHELLKEYPNVAIDHVLILQHFKDLFSDNFTWEEKWSLEECQRPSAQLKQNDKNKEVHGYRNISVKNVQCVSFHGSAALLKNVLDSFKGRFVLLEHAEVVLHDYYGGEDYWKCRKSMKFSDELINIATLFRKDVFGLLEKPAINITNNESDPYLCVHLRRRDYVRARPNEVPSIEWAAIQIKKIMENLNLDIVFVASDAFQEELNELNSALLPFKMVRYRPNKKIKEKFKDGGVAIIEQIICSHAKYFIGTYESTFSFRIQEERELMNFHPDSTFNRLCGDGQITCKQPTRWLKNFDIN